MSIPFNQVFILWHEYTRIILWNSSIFSNYNCKLCCYSFRDTISTEEKNILSIFINSNNLFMVLSIFNVAQYGANCYGSKVKKEILHFKWETGHRYLLVMFHLVLIFFLHECVKSKKVNIYCYRVNKWSFLHFSACQSF